jgi:23S rRNA (adenine2030-N6)-methyltransferase
MFAYRHLFHAGNFADVFKHALLTRLLIALAKKPKPFCYIDTHAGTGRYDLDDEWARKNAEFADGIGRLWSARNVPPELEPYLAIVRKENPNGKLRYYPGSPLIARALLRPEDRAVLSELNQKDFIALGNCMEHQRKVLIQHEDGYQTLKAQLPPPERRALVLIDSSFDRAGEYTRLVHALVEAQRRFATGVFAIWYPMMAPNAVLAFDRSIIGTGIRRILRCELEVHPPRWNESLRGTGLIVVNPPFGFEPEARTLLGWLTPLLQQSEGAWRVDWRAGE